MPLILIYAIMLVVAMVSMYFMMKSMQNQGAQKASEAEDFSITTAQDRPIQYVTGTVKLLAPNIAWYGKVRTTPIKTKAGKKKVVTGHKYYLGAMLGLCFGPNVRVLKIGFGEKQVAWTSETPVGTGDIEINNPELFGGQEQGGGVMGTISFYDGSPAQNADPYLNSAIGADKNAAYRNMAYAVLKDFYVGNSASIQSPWFELQRFSPSPAGNTTYENVLGDSNPAYIIAELWRNDFFGGSIPDLLIDFDSIEAAAKTLYEEGMGLSILRNESSDISELVSNVLKHIEARSIVDVVTGKLTLKLVRKDYVVADLPVIDESMIRSVTDFSKGSVTSAISEVRLKYTSRKNDYEEKVVMAQNTGLRVHKGYSDATTVDYLYATRSEVAQQIAARVLVPYSSPLTNATIDCNRELFMCNVGDPFVLNWPPLGIKNMVMRIMTISLGTLKKGSIRLTAVQDVFGSNETIYIAPEEPDYSDGRKYAEPVAQKLLTECPPFLDDETKSVGRLLCAAVDANGELGYSMYSRQSNDPDYNYDGKNGFSISGVIVSQTASGYEVSGEDLNQLSNATTGLLQNGTNLMYVDNINPALSEWFAFRTVSQLPNGNYEIKDFERGLIDTIAVDHEIGSRIWFINESYMASGQTYTAGYVYTKLLTYRSGDAMTMASATEFATQFVGRYGFPRVPGRVRINGVAEGGNITRSATNTLTFARRSRAQTNLIFQDDALDTVDTGVSYNIYIYQTGIQKAHVYGLTTASWTMPSLLTLLAAGAFEVRIEAVATGGNSYTMLVRKYIAV